MAYAALQFERASTAGDGNAKGDHLDAARRHPLYKSEEVQPTARLPYELAYLWEWFNKLTWKREVGMGVNPLTSAEILAWQQRHRLRFEPYEEAIIDRLDALYIGAHNKPRDKA